MKIYSTTPSNRGWQIESNRYCSFVDFDFWEYSSILISSGMLDGKSIGVFVITVWKCLGWRRWLDSLPFLLVINFELVFGKGAGGMIWASCSFHGRNFDFFFFEYLWRNQMQVFLFYINNVKKDKIFIYTFV